MRCQRGLLGGLKIGTKLLTWVFCCLVLGAPSVAEGFDSGGLQFNAVLISTPDDQVVPFEGENGTHKERGSGGSFARIQFDSVDGTAVPYHELGSGIQWSARPLWWWPLQCFRQGEALNPGPHPQADELLHVGTTNPTGLRGKEHIYGGLPYGIWGIAETHLSQAGMQPALASLRATGQGGGRGWRLLPGAPVPLRARSEIAGTWAGVMQVSDLPSRKVHIPWPAGQYAAGRVMLSQHWLGHQGVTGAMIYGWSPGPTWPQARSLTDKMLLHLTDHLVMRRSGFRFIMGDFNHPEEHLEAVTMWKSMGWVEVQELHLARHNEPIQPTCKGKTRRDMVYVSPELAAFFISASVEDLFPDHSVVWGAFRLGHESVPKWIWPQPQTIDWSKVQVDAWQRQFAKPITLPSESLTGNQWFEQWADAYERSLEGFVDLPGGGLPPGAKGRGKVKCPVQQQAQLPMCRPARDGDLRLVSDFACRGVQLWYRQARRLQALTQSLQRGTMTASAQAHRVETWAAIERAAGFKGGFRNWWRTRPVQHQGLPVDLPVGVPALKVAQQLLVDFTSNFRKLESWQLRRQQEISKAQLIAHRERIFKRVRLHEKEYLDTLQHTEETEILAVAEDGSEIQLEHEIGRGPCDSQLWLVDSMTAIQLERKEADVYRVIDADCLLVAGQSTVSESDWGRILAFGRAFLPRSRLEYKPLDVHGWHDINTRYTDRAARGPDGFHGRDLQVAPKGLQMPLLELLTAIEEQQIDWPDQLLAGFVACLAKTATAAEAAHYRPIIIFSTIYRSWSTARARPLLAHLATLATDTQLGFLPGKEALQISFMIQGLVELCVSAGSALQGLVTDIQKAFENIPRLPMMRPKWNADSMCEGRLVHHI